MQQPRGGVEDFAPEPLPVVVAECGQGSGGRVRGQPPVQQVAPGGTIQEPVGPGGEALADSAGGASVLIY